MSIVRTGDRPAGALALFVRQAGPRYGDHVAVPAPVVTIGNAPQCDVVLDDDSVSANHARLEFDSGSWRLTDLESTNGTAVEGVRLAPGVPTPLPYGASVRFGGFSAIFRAAEADPEAARAEYVPPPPKKTLKEESAGFRFPLWLAALILLALVVAALFFTGVLPVEVSSAAPPASWQGAASVSSPLPAAA